MLVEAHAAYYNKKNGLLSASVGFHSPSGLRGLDKRAGMAELDAAKPHAKLRGEALCTAIAIPLQSL